MSIETGKEFSEQRIAALAKKLHIRGDRYMRLELGTPHGLRTGYPELQFHKFEDKYFLDAKIPSEEPGYDKIRELTLHEMLIFVRVASQVVPENPLTRALVDHTKNLLTQKRDELTTGIQTIDEALRFIAAQK